MINQSNNNPFDWSVLDVRSWAIDAKLSEEIVRALWENEVGGEELLSLTTEEMRQDIGIKSMKDRRRLKVEIYALNGLALSCNECKIVETQASTVKSAKEDFDMYRGGKFSNEDADFELALEIQLNDVYKLESAMENLEIAVSHQLGYNKLLLLEVSDSLVAPTLNNLDDQAFEIALRNSDESRKKSDESLRSLREIDPLKKSPIKENDIKISDIKKEENTDEKLIKSFKSLNASDDICIVCSLNFDQHRVKFQIKSKCGHSYCKNCFKDFLKSAQEDSSLLPLKCCKQVFPMDIVNDVASELLGENFANKLAAQLDEITCANKMFCPNPRCSVFINLDRVEAVTDFDATFLCPVRSCGTRICYECKSIEHNKYISCIENQRLMKISEETTTSMFNKLEYQKCSTCNVVVELSEGCNHMTCNCGHEFCYECGVTWKTCTCATWNEERLLLEAQRNVPANIIGVARVQALQVFADQARIEMQEEEECYHPRMYRSDEYAERRNKPRCYRCSRRLNLFGYVCANCPRKLCIGCRFHR